MASQHSLMHEITFCGGVLHYENGGVIPLHFKALKPVNVLSLSPDENLHLSETLAWLLSHFPEKELKKCHDPFMIDENGFGKLLIKHARHPSIKIISLKFSPVLAEALQKKTLLSYEIRDACEKSSGINYDEFDVNVGYNQIYKIPRSAWQTFYEGYDTGYESDPETEFDPYDYRVYHGIGINKQN